MASNYGGVKGESGWTAASRRTARPRQGVSCDLVETEMTSQVTVPIIRKITSEGGKKTLTEKNGEATHIILSQTPK